LHFEPTIRPWYRRYIAIGVSGLPTPTSYAQFSFLFTATVTIIGWFVVARQTDRREYRKEVREQVKEVRDRAVSVRSSAAAYWLNSDKKLAGANSASLKAELLSLSRQVQALRLSGLDFRSEELMAAARGHATGGDFDKRSRVRSEADEERLADIVGAIEDLILAVDAAFYNKFKPHSSRRWWQFIPLLGTLLIARD